MAERITGHTELIGLMAYPIRHSSSPAMHNEAFAYLGLDYAYLAFEVDNSTLEDAVKGLRALKMVGSNVSMPNKTVVGQYLDKLSPAAELCGAVNTIVNEDGVLTGHITDGIGFMQALKDNDIDVIGKKMTIAGAGGAATAIEIQAALDGVKEISIFNIHDKFWANAEETVKKINELSRRRDRSGFSPDSNLRSAYTDYHEIMRFFLLCIICYLIVKIFECFNRISMLVSIPL